MTTTHKKNLYKGAALTICATLTYCLMDATAKYLVSTYSPFQVSFFRALVGFLIIGSIVVATGKTQQLKTKRPGMHFIRAVIFLILYFIFFYALAHIPLVVIEAIAHTAPFYVAMLSPWILKEKVSVQTWAAIIIGFVGIGLILRPDTGEFHIAYPLMVIAAFLYSLLIITARIMKDDESLLAMNFYIYPLAVVVLAWFCKLHWIQPEPIHWLGFILIGVLGTFGVFIFIYAIRFIEATTAATLEYFTLVWASLFGYLIWQEVPGPVTITGILLVVGTGIYIVRHSTRKIDETIIETTDH